MARALFVAVVAGTAVARPLRTLVDEALRELVSLRPPASGVAAAIPLAASPIVSPREEPRPTVIESNAPSLPTPLPIEESSEEPPDDAAPSEILQSWSRTRREGTEVIEGEISIRFAPGERQVLVHLPIQPVLAAAPQVECEPIEGDDVELSVDLVTPFGVRVRASRTSGIERAACVPVAVLMTAETALGDAA